MATGTYPGGIAANTVSGVTSSATFIPEIWSDEVIAAYKKQLKLSGLVKKLSVSGKKGDTIHIPKPTRGSAFAKAEATAVTIQANTESELTVSINRHYEYSRLIEDIVEVQALASMRKMYTDDAGYQLALRVDTDLMNTATGFGNGTVDLAPDGTGADWVNTNAYYFDAATGLSTYAADTVTAGDNFTDLGFREAIKLMDDANVPMDGRIFVIPPAMRKTLMGLERYVSNDFRKENTVGTGYIGTVYGVDFYVSTNCPVIETAANNAASSVDTVAGLFMHKDALLHAEQMGVRSQSQYKQEYLAYLYTADTLYGTQVYRPEAGFILAVADE
jgi:N4-gp56 family major capsid protein